MWIEFLVVLVCGIGTFLLRFLPIWRIRRRSHRRHIQQPPDTRQHIHRFFAGIGPAALTALLLVSLWSFFDNVENAPRIMSALIALLVVYVSKRLTRSLAGSTLIGAVTYGVLMHWMTIAAL